MIEVVRTADAGHVPAIKLNRPEKRNALSDEVAWAEEAAVVNDTVWVIALTGSGDSFCAGVALSPKVTPRHCRRRKRGKPSSRSERLQQAVSENSGLVQIIEKVEIHLLGTRRGLAQSLGVLASGRASS